MNKFRNQKQSVPCHYGFSHRSKLEASVCQLIHLREKAGEIKHVGHERHIHLTRAKIIYIADFEVLDQKTQAPLFIESKGFETDRWPTIKKLWKVYGPGPLEIWKGSHVRPTLVETIYPTG